MSKIPNGLTVIYFDDKDKNIYAELRSIKSKPKGCQSAFIRAQ